MSVLYIIGFIRVNFDFESIYCQRNAVNRLCVNPLVNTLQQVLL